MLKQSRVVLIILLTAGLAVGITAAPVYADNFKQYGSIKKLANAIDDGNFDDDSVNFKSLKSWSGYKKADGEIKDCIDDKHDLGNNLGDYEILKCVDKYN